MDLDIFLTPISQPGSNPGNIGVELCSISIRMLIYKHPI